MATRSGRLPGRGPQLRRLHPRADDGRRGSSAAAPQLPGGRGQGRRLSGRLGWAGERPARPACGHRRGALAGRGGAVRRAGRGAVRRSRGGRVLLLLPRGRAAGGAPQGPGRQPDAVRPVADGDGRAAAVADHRPGRGAGRRRDPAGHALYRPLRTCLRRAAAGDRHVRLAAGRGGDRRRPRESRHRAAGRAARSGFHPTAVMRSRGTAATCRCWRARERSAAARRCMSASGSPAGRRSPTPSWWRCRERRSAEGAGGRGGRRGRGAKRHAAGPGHWLDGGADAGRPGPEAG